MMIWVGLETTKKQGGGNKVTRIRILNTMGLVQVDEFLDIHNFNHLCKGFSELGIPSLKLQLEPENGWLQYDRFLLGSGLLSGAFTVSFREGIGGKVVRWVLETTTPT